MSCCLKSYEISPFNDGSQVMLKDLYVYKRFLLRGAYNNGRRRSRSRRAEAEESWKDEDIEILINLFEDIVCL